jgi:diaminopimelate decarboxylase
MLTTQEVPEGGDRRALEERIKRGMRYNVCSLRQLRLIADFARTNCPELSVRVHPGIGAGESASRNTGDDYACFGIHLTDSDRRSTRGRIRLRFTQSMSTSVRGDPSCGGGKIDLDLGFIEKISRRRTVSFGAG